MTSIKTYLNSLGRGVRTTVIALAVVFVSAGIAQAATTISTNILTNGTLGATGVSTFGGTASTTISVAGVLTTPAGATALFLGGASTTQFTLLSGDTIKNASASSTVLSGRLTSDLLTVSGAATLSSTVGVTGLATFLGGASTTQFTLLSGDTIKNASASSTVISRRATNDGWLYRHIRLVLYHAASVTGATTLSSTLAVTGATTLSASTTVGTATLFAGDDLNRVGVGTTTPLDIFMVEHQTATTTVVISTGAAAKGGRIILEDIDGAGCSEISALNGTLTAITVTCPTGI